MSPLRRRKLQLLPTRAKGPREVKEARRREVKIRMARGHDLRPSSLTLESLIGLSGLSVMPAVL